MARKKLSQRDVGGIAGWNQSRVNHTLTGRIEMTIAHLEGYAFALGISPAELVRDRGMEFYAEMTPTEFRLLERFRSLTPDQQHAVLTVLNVQSGEPRRAAPLPKKRTK